MKFPAVTRIVSRGSNIVARLDKADRRFLLWASAFKILYLILVHLFSALFLDYERDRAEGIRDTWFPEIWDRKDRSDFENRFVTWDAEHYLYLSEYGYDAGVRSCAFYPLWPLAIHLGTYPFLGNHVVSGMVLSNLFSLGGWFLFYRISRRRFGERNARTAAIWLILFPGSLFHQYIYSESLFLLLLMLLWYGIEHRRYGTTILAALMLPMTRGVGLFAVVPVLWHVLMILPQRFKPSWKWLRLERERITGGRRVESEEYTQCAFLLIAPPAGWFLYLALMEYWTGNMFEGVQAQKYWGHAHSIGNLFDIPKFVTGLFDIHSLHDVHHSMLDRVCFLFMSSSLIVMFLRCRDMLPWIYMLGIATAMSGTFTSYTRFMSLSFPVFIAYSLILSDLKSGPLKSFCLIPFVVVHAWLVLRFVNYQWAG